MAQQKAGRARLPLWLRIFFAILVITFLAAGSAFGVLLGYQYNLPPIQSLEDYRPDVITEVYSDDNRVIGELYLERRIIVSHDEIPPYLQLAILPPKTISSTSTRASTTFRSPEPSSRT